MLWAFALTSLVLSLNLLALWIFSGASRARAGVAINPEDGARYGVSVSEIDPPAVARCLRAHRNAEATIYPFLAMAVVYVLAGGRAAVASRFLVCSCSPASPIPSFICGRCSHGGRSPSQRR